jgi:serine/threonine protein phosphatase PrpC
VSQICLDESKRFFERVRAIGDPSEYVKKVIANCDRRLKKSGVDITFSGTTGIAVLVYKGVVYAASVGDSRAIAAC